MKKVILVFFVLALIVVNIKIVFSDAESFSIEEIGLQVSHAIESSTAGKCMQLSYVSCEREVQTNGSNLPDGVYLIKLINKECWSGSEKQCERGSVVETYNITGQLVETNGSFNSVNC